MANNLCRINGIEFDVTVAISALEESFNVLDGENVGRVLSGRMIRDIIGTYIGHVVTFFNGRSREDFDALWDYLVKHSVDDSVMVELADGQSVIAYEAYYTSGKRGLIKREGGVNSWDEIQVSFVPMDAQVRLSEAGFPDGTAYIAEALDAINGEVI